MTKKVYESLQQFDKELLWALKQNFLRLSVSEFNIIAQAYYDTFGTPLSKTQMTCSACKLNATKKLAGEYFKYKAEKEEKEKKEEEPQITKEEPKKNKVGRPPKIKLED